MYFLKIVNDNCFNVSYPVGRLLLTDIAYNEVNRSSNNLRVLHKQDADISTFELHLFLELVYPFADIFCIFCGNKQYSELYSFFADKQDQKLGTVRQLIYAKSNPSPMNGEYIYLSATENAVWFKKKGTGKLTNKCAKNYIIAPSGSSKYHPTEKNHKLLADIILQNTQEGDLVIDPCMGSGSSGLVALSLNRSFFGVELNPSFYNIAETRLKNKQKEFKS